VDLDSAAPLRKCSYHCRVQLPAWKGAHVLADGLPLPLPETVSFTDLTQGVGKLIENPESPSKHHVFGRALNDVEHAIGMYAYSYFTMPAEAIYDKAILQSMMSVIETCHIYCIGYTPIVDFTGASQTGDELNIQLNVLGKEYTVTYSIPDLIYKMEDGYNFLEDATGERMWPDMEHVQARLNNEFKAVTFDVKYIGQAYGQDGSRNAIDRLLKMKPCKK
jgi:hypothetical protein